MPSAPSPITIITKSTILPSQKSNLNDLKLSVSDLPMLSCHYIQKGLLFSLPPPDTTNTIPNFDSLISLLQSSLSHTLSLFPPLAGRLKTDPQGYIFVESNDVGADFIRASATHLSTLDVLCPKSHVPDFVKSFFALNSAVSYDGHRLPILTVQVTELDDGVFIGCSVNHAVTDGTSFWNFFNTFALIAKEQADGFIKQLKIRNASHYERNSVLISNAVMKLPEGGPKITFNELEPLSERIFSFTRESILKLKSLINKYDLKNEFDETSLVELMGKVSNDVLISMKKKEEISSFQALCALLWRAVTRARGLSDDKITTFKMAVNCRHRLEPKLDPLYFGNAIQSIPTQASAGDVLRRDLRWCAQQLNRNVMSYDDQIVRHVVNDWEENPRCFPLGNFDRATITMGSSPRFPMYDNDFGFGRPLAVRSGKANKFDGKISAFPGREGNGSVDLEVVLAPETMCAVESDWEFMQYVSS